MNNEIKYLKNALDLIVKYTQDNETIRENLQKKGYDGKPLFFYIPILIAHSNEYRKYYNQVFHAPVTSAKDQIKLYLKKMLKGQLGPEEGDSLKVFFTKCLKNTTVYNGLRQETRPLGLFSESQLQQIENFSQVPLNTQSATFFNQLINNFSKSQNTYVPSGGYAQPTEPQETPKQFKENLNQELTKIPGKEIKYVEKSHPKTSPEAVKKLEELLSQTASKTSSSGLTDIHGQPLRTYNPPTPPPQVSPTPTPSIHVPRIHLPSTISGALKTGSSNAQIATGGFLKNTLPRAISGTGKGILKGLGIGGKSLGGAGLKAVAGLGSKAALASNPVGWGILAVQNWKIFVYIGISFIIFFFLFSNLLQTGSLFPPFAGIGEAAPLPPGYSGNIASCNFYRGGDSTSELKFQIPEWPVLINDIATKTGVPAVLLAAILRVECGGCFASNNPTYIKNDYDAHSSGVAFGVTQFTPGTFSGIFNTNLQDLKNIFNKTSVRTDIDPQNSMALSDVFRIYSIKDSLIATAYKLKEDKGSGDWNNENTIRDIASMYFSGRRLNDPKNCTKYPDCFTGPYDYGDDLWKSYSQCQPTSTPTQNIASSCPAVGKISTPYGYNIPGYPEVGNEGCGSLPSCHNGVDIAAAESSPVKSTISGTVTAKSYADFKGNYVEITDASGLTATFEHLASFDDNVVQGAAVTKGKVIGYVGRSGQGVTGPVLHYKLSKGGSLINPLMVLGTSAALDSKTLISSDDIAQNNYNGISPSDGSGYWGQCNFSD